MAEPRSINGTLCVQDGDSLGVAVETTAERQIVTRLGSIIAQWSFDIPGPEDYRNGRADGSQKVRVSDGKIVHHAGGGEAVIPVTDTASVRITFGDPHGAQVQGITGLKMDIGSNDGVVARSLSTMKAMVEPGLLNSTSAGATLLAMSEAYARKAEHMEKGGVQPEKIAFARDTSAELAAASDAALNRTKPLRAILDELIKKQTAFKSFS